MSFFEHLGQQHESRAAVDPTGLVQELGDNGQLFNPVFVGCTHPEHQI